MSESALHRFRAERLLRKEFTGMRPQVIAAVARRLRGHGVDLDGADLEACYSQAWHGLYGAVCAGEQIESVTAWLTLVTYRRAIDEHRARARRREATLGVDLAVAGGGGGADRSPPAPCSVEPGAPERDLAGELDDRVRLRQLLEGLRGRLSPRERRAATLCYLQGYSRAEAAARLGISQQRMQRLMEGRGDSRPGVAAKVGQLLEVIQHGAFCEQQGSLMRAFAFGVLDPTGERYQLALSHRRECPACRAYVVGLRGLAAVLPPLPLPVIAATGAGAGVARSAGATAPSSALGGSPLAVKLAVSLALAASAGGVVLARGSTKAPARAHAPRVGALGPHAPAGAHPQAHRTRSEGGSPHAEPATAERAAGGGVLPSAASEFGPERGSAASQPEQASSAATAQSSSATHAQNEFGLH